jgi:uncharacterized protein YdeI (YjbR/CyaY-like superfamily)
MRIHPKVNEYLDKMSQWKPELEQLRRIVLDCGLTEELKWRQPCYTFQSNNILILGVFENYCTISFFKGVLLQDIGQLLVPPGENSQSVKMFKFTKITEILELYSTIKAYIFEVLEVEKAGLKVKFNEIKDQVLADELIQKFKKLPDLKTAFESLTPGRQRGYNLHFTGSKNSSTRISRIEKYIPRILKGIGIQDCICGLSNRMPTCDGSHKALGPDALTY